MLKMEKLNVVRYVETEKEKQRLIEQGYSEVKSAPKKGGKNGDAK